jgi:succinate dehydrogenase/fumarate reductase flavoprotein subunit
LELTVAGAGMAGLVAAARARELGADVQVLEKGTRSGGSMLLSSCVPWRHLEWEGFRAECPGGDERLQRLVWERFDDAIAWLERTTRVEPVWRDTNNPSTTGRRYDPVALTDALVGSIGRDRLSLSAKRWAWVHMAHPLLMATGGFPVRITRERGLLVRSNPWSEGDGLEHALARGAALAGDLDEFYGRALPAPPARIREQDYVGLSQLYGGRARVLNEQGEEFFVGPPAWHENDLAQAIGRQPGGTAWFELEDRDDPKVEAARAAGGTVVEEGGAVHVHVGVGVTHTMGGLRVDEAARVLRDDDTPIEGLYAAGVDVGGIATGGYASGLAQALVLGLVASESALAT